MEFECFGPGIYEDLAAGSMEPLPYLNGNLYGGIYPNTNLLGGTKLQKQLDADKFEGKKKTKKVLLWSLGTITAVGAGLIFKKQIGKVLKAGWNGLKNIFHKKPSVTP